MALVKTLEPEIFRESLNSFRSARVRIEPLKQLSFKKMEGPQAVVYKINNVSPTGLALLRESPDRIYEIGHCLDGHFQIEGMTYVCRLAIRHITGPIVGCQIVEGSDPKLSEMLEEFFVAELLAQRLRFAEERTSDQFADSWIHCLSDGYQNEIGFIECDGKIRYFHVALLGLYMEGGSGQRWKFGYLVRNPVRDEIRSHLFDVKEHRSYEVIGLIRLARKLIRHMSHIETHVRAALLTELGG